MKYPDGTLARLGDKIIVWEGNEGVVVCSMDTDEYSEEYPKENFGYLERGIMVLSEKAGADSLCEARNRYAPAGAKDMKASGR